MAMITGIVTDEGVECAAMRATNGTLYTFTNLPQEIKSGTKISVEGEELMTSFCQQGTTLKLTKAVEHDENGAAKHTWNLGKQ